MGMHDESIRSYHEALDLEPDYVIAKWHMALTYRSVGLYEDALRYFQECGASGTEVDYINDEIHYQTGLCFFDMGWTKEALTEFRKHIDLCPSDTWAHLSIGNCYFDFGWIDESAAKFREVISLSPEFIPAYNALALSLAEKGWYDEALDVLRAALSISPDDESVKDNMDYIQSLKEDDDGAKGVILMGLILQLMKKKELSE
jgi:tetratricopeptide (TPR) repeat protein